jgi:hypothetical protein
VAPREPSQAHRTSKWRSSIFPWTALSLEPEIFGFIGSLIHEDIMIDLHAQKYGITQKIKMNFLISIIDIHQFESNHNDDRNFQLKLFDKFEFLRKSIFQLKRLTQR